MAKVFMKFSKTIEWFKNQINSTMIVEINRLWWLTVLIPILLNTSLTIGLLRYYSAQRNIRETNNSVNHYTERTNNRLVPRNSSDSKYLPYFWATIILELLTLTWLVILVTKSNLLKPRDSLTSNQEIAPKTELEIAPNGTSNNQNYSDEPYLLLADMSHELRSPLNAILGFVQIMQQEQSISQSSQDNIAIIHRSGERLLSIINNVIDLAKIETDRLNLERNNIDFYSWLDNTQQSIQFQAQDRGWEFDLIKEPDLPQYICIDERRLRQMIANLIDYCLKLSPTAEINKVSVRVKCDPTPIVTENIVNRAEFFSTRNICIEVENSNCAIADEEITSLFDLGVRAKQQHNLTEGSSLDLPISRKLAQLMGGDISVATSNNSARGIIFRLKIPVEIIAAQKLPVDYNLKRVIGLESGQTEYRILVVDDSKTNRKIMLQLLEPVGFKVQEAVNGREAVDIWMRWQPHMIWMDLRMPVMNGYEATELIKSYSKTPQCTPIIAFSASTLEEDKSRFKAAGCDDFVGKPFSESIIFDKIAQHLGIRYIYESTRPPLNNFKLTADALNIMSADWINRLEQAATVLDGSSIAQLLQEIPPEHIDLKNALQKQVDNFDFDEILALASKTKSN